MEKVIFKYLPEGAQFVYYTAENSRHIGIKLPVCKEGVYGHISNFYDVYDRKFYYYNICSYVNLPDKILYNTFTDHYEIVE